MKRKVPKECQPADLEQEEIEFPEINRGLLGEAIVHYVNFREFDDFRLVDWQTSGLPTTSAVVLFRGTMRLMKVPGVTAATIPIPWNVPFPSIVMRLWSTLSAANNNMQS